MRANKDYKAFKRLGSSDPALSVYLLQQCVEKTIKALAISSGKYQLSDIKGKFSHRSVDLLLDFWQNLEVASGNNQKSVAAIRSMTKVDKAKPEEVLSILQFLKDLHKLSLSFIRSCNIETGDTINWSFRAITEGSLKRMTYISEPKPDVADKRSLDDLSYCVFLEFRDILDRSEDKSGTVRSKDFFIRRFLGKWALLALLILAGITFSHENRSRYPDINGKGCDNYTEALGIVKYRDSLGDICKMTLSYADYVFEIIPALFPVAKTGKLSNGRCISAID
ncbi:MAG: hypothetical protein JW732_08865 [Dehalococcoidia bacterium]|nr:hypothetical protein [Dehalococcoidia bacterium]